MSDRKAGLAVGAYIIFFCAAAIIGGQILRGEVSPWFWEQYSMNASRYGRADALLSVGLYLVFYAIGFIIPYSIISIAIWFRFTNEGSRKMLLDRGLQTSIFLASFGCLLSFVLFLDSEAAFVRSMPTEIGNGWLLILVSGASLFLLFAGLRGIWEEVSKERISVKLSADIFCRCPHCGNEWTFPAERLRTHNVLFER